SGLVSYALDKWFGLSGNWALLFAGVALIVTLILNPEGVAGANYKKGQQRRARRAAESAAAGADAPAGSWAERRAPSSGPRPAPAGPLRARPARAPPPVLAVAREVDVVHAVRRERIQNSVVDGRRRADRARLADPLRAELVRGRRRLHLDHLPQREVRRRGESV